MFQDDGILVIPTIADPPLKLNKGSSTEFHDRACALLSVASMSGGCQVAFAVTRLKFSIFYVVCNLDIRHLFNLTISSQVSVPLGEHDGCPISVSFVAYHGADKFLLDTVLDMYASLQEQVSIASNSTPLPDFNGTMDASELLKEKVFPPLTSPNI